MDSYPGIYPGLTKKQIAIPVFHTFFCRAPVPRDLQPARGRGIFQIMKHEYHPSEIPAGPGVYVFRDRFGQVIYVGKAVNLRRRLGNYFQPARAQRADPKLRSLIHSIDDWSYQQVRTEDEALILESRLIKDFAPYYNILMRDDKRYLLLKLDEREKFPTLRCARLRKDDGARYFGPFPHGSALRSTLEFLLAHFGLRGCLTPEPDAETRKRCLKRIVRDCCAPCTGDISPEAYRARVAAALAVLDGDIAGLSDELKRRMAEAAAAAQFEAAARWRDVLANLETVCGRHNRNFVRAELPWSPSGMSGVESLQTRLGLENPPRQIICFDISNILGTLAVASLVTFRDGRPERDSYRRFRIRTVDHSDDFAMMKEAVTRHFSRLMRESRPFPDLLMVDGGKGQLSSALDALLAIGAPPLPVIGLAKRNEEIFLPGDPEPVVIDRHDPAIRLLQAVRDEAHRFAISYHRELRIKRLSQSLLDDLEGVGPVRKRELLRAFGSVRALRRADAPEIVRRVPGIGETLAAKIAEALKK